MEEREEPRIIMRTVYEFQHIITTILEFQIIFMGFEFQKTLASIADELSHLNAQIKTGNKEIVISNSVPSIRSSATLYTETCDVVERFNACNGLLVFSFIILYTLQLVFTADSLANTLQYNKLNSRLAVNCCLDVMWLLFHNIRTIIFIQPWHRISKEVCQIKIQLGKLLQGLAAYEKEILWESKVFYTEVMINNAELKPLGLFTVSRYLFVQIMSVVITYTLVVVQLRN
ncbi:unnamed protein product [Leptosia nina]|uniref:Gustatory receptor n=1 Tax=Leptosia nina TaxID=320188 RepID=A0AAV1J4U0_9NEOP